VLCDLLGKSFDLILTAASSTGKLQQLTSRLTKLNQCSRQVTGEAGKASATRAMIFDVSFLMLAYIGQKYGSQVFLLIRLWILFTFLNILNNVFFCVSLGSVL
jgi:hypothetical protein